MKRTDNTETSTALELLKNWQYTVWRENAKIREKFGDFSYGSVAFISPVNDWTKKNSVILAARLMFLLNFKCP